MIKFKIVKNIEREGKARDVILKLIVMQARAQPVTCVKIEVMGAAPISWCTGYTRFGN